jgi:hypothetical protein
VRGVCPSRPSISSPSPVPTYLHAASEHMGGLGALYVAEEVLLSPLVLARTSIEHSSHAAWIIGSSEGSAVDRLARAYLEEIHSAEHAKMDASRIYGKDSTEYKLRRGHFREVKKEARSLFDAPYHDHDGIPICHGHMLPSPEEFVLHMNRAATRPLADDEVSGTYGLLSSHVHPTTTHIIRELFDVGEEKGLVIPRLTRDITYHERLARLVDVFFYNAVTYVSSYHGWAPTSHRRLTDLIDRYLPDVFEGDPRPGPFDTSAAG